MPGKVQGNNKPAPAGFGKRTKRAFKRFFGMKVSNNANKQTKKQSGNQYKSNNILHKFSNIYKSSKILWLLNTYIIIITPIENSENYTVTKFDKHGNEITDNEKFVIPRDLIKYHSSEYNAIQEEFNFIKNLAKTVKKGRYSRYIPINELDDLITDINTKSGLGLSQNSPSISPEHILLAERHNPFNTPKPAEERIKLFGSYEFVITDDGKHNYTIVINSLDKHGNVVLANISVQDLNHEKLRELPRDINIEASLLVYLDELKQLLPNEEGEYLTITKAENKQPAYTYNTNSKAVIYHIKSLIHTLNFLGNMELNYTGPIPEYNENASNKVLPRTPAQQPEIEPAPAKKKSGFRSRATKRIKKARNVLVSGVKRAGRGIVYGAKWIGTQTKKRLTALTGFFTNIFSKFDNTAERQASEFKEESYVHVGREELKPADLLRRSQHEPTVIIPQLRNNKLTQTTLVGKMTSVLGPTDGSVKVENVVTINLYNKFKLVIKQNDTGKQDYEFTIHLQDDADNKAISWDNFREGVLGLVGYNNDAKDKITTYLDKGLASTFKLDSSPKNPKYKFTASTYESNNIDKFATHIREIGNIIDNYNISKQQGNWTDNPFGPGNENQMQTKL